jgi:hypothetical protein
MTAEGVFAKEKNSTVKTALFSDISHSLTTGRNRVLAPSVENPSRPLKI